MPTRRVVTGHDRHGASVVAADEQLEPLRSPGLPGVEMSYLWGFDQPQRYPDDGTMPDWSTHFPPRDGARFVIFSLPPAGHPVPEDAGTDAARADADAQFPGLLGTFEDDHPGMHASDTTDFAIVLRGEVVLELDGGVERTLGPGDVVVQNGTRHRWSNRGAERVSLGFVLLGAERATAG
jgi:quercetin dioxygenase-like cupin family protein